MSRIFAIKLDSSAQPNPRGLSAACGEGKVLGDRQVRGGSAKRVLEYAADEPRAAMLRPAGYVSALDMDAARVDQECSGNRVQQRGFSRAIRSDDDYERTVFDGEIDALQGPHLVGRAGIKRL